MKKLLMITSLLATLLVSPIHSEQSCLGQDLINAINENNVLRVKNLLTLISPNATNKYGEIALIEAAGEGSVEIVKILIDAGANVNAQDNNDNGCTALIEAADEQEQPKLLKILIDAGANVNIACNNGFTALMAAAAWGHTENLKVLIDAGANVNAEAQEFINGEEGPKGCTALMEATKHNHIENLKVLIDAGANVNAACNDGSTALMYAAKYGHIESLKVLIKAGANVNAMKGCGTTALMHAAENNLIEVLKVLIKAGANVNGMKTYGPTPTPLMLANSSEAREILITAGAIK